MTLAEIPERYRSRFADELGPTIPATLGDDSVLGAFLSDCESIVLVSGAAGIGKTRVACGLLCEVIARRYYEMADALRFRYINAEQSFTEFRRDTFDNENRDHLAMFANTLVIDDVDCISDKDMATLSRFVNVRSTEGRITILTCTDMTRLDALNDRAKRRVLMSRKVAL